MHDPERAGSVRGSEHARATAMNLQRSARTGVRMQLIRESNLISASKNRRPMMSH